MGTVYTQLSLRERRKSRIGGMQKCPFEKWRVS